VRKFAFLILVVLAVLSIPKMSAAQETYSIDLSIAQVAAVEWDRVRYNGDMCLAGGLPATCTQGQLNAVPGHASDNMFAATLAGRQSFLKKSWILDRMYIVNTERNRRDTSQFCTWWNGLAQGSKDTQCASTFGLAAGCMLCL